MRKPTMLRRNKIFLIEFEAMISRWKAGEISDQEIIQELADHLESQDQIYRLEINRRFTVAAKIENLDKIIKPKTSESKNIKAKLKEINQVLAGN